MIHHYQVIPECYADTLLVSLLGFTNLNHQQGIGKVIKMFRDKPQNLLMVGIIDDDKLKPKILDQFNRKEERHGIKRLVDGKISVLIISPAFEAWIFDNARQVDLDPAKFRFRDKVHFRTACKSQNANNNQDLKQFLNALKQKQAPGFEQLKSWICKGAGIAEIDLK